MKKITGLIILTLVCFNMLAGCDSAEPQPPVETTGISDAIETVEVVPIEEKNLHFKLCGITIRSLVHSLWNSNAPGLPLYFFDVDKKVTVEIVDSELYSYTVDPNSGALITGKSSKTHEFTEDMSLCYSVGVPKSDGKVDSVKIVVYDGENIVGCALLHIYTVEIQYVYVISKAVEFPKVDGKYQDISIEAVNAIFDN